ncbi:MAG: transposase [bacterium]|nr:transposase [bacterium]
MSRCGDYPSNLTNDQWRMIKRELPQAQRLGRKPICRRRIINAIFYWNTVYGFFRDCRRDGTWQQIHAKLLEKVRNVENRKPTSTVTIIDG